MTEPMDIINCAELNEVQLEVLRSLSISKDQEEFGGTFAESLDASLSETAGAVQGFVLWQTIRPSGLLF